MKSIVREAGQRPLISTPSRLNAPQGAKALADMMAEEDFADMCIITLDWEGDGITPVLAIEVFKWFVGDPPRRLSVGPWNIDMDDAFGADNMENAVLRLMVSDLRDLFHQETDGYNRRKG
jgi:hypothetical protein